MGLFDAVRSTALRGKVNAEKAFLETQKSRLPASLGVALFDALQSLKTHQQPPKQLLAIIGEDYQETAKQVKTKKDEMDAKSIEYERVTVRKERTTALQDSTTEKTKTWVSNTASQAQLQASIQLIDRDILLLKQQFGKNVYDRVLEYYAQQQSHKKTGQSLKNKLTKAAAETFGNGQPKQETIMMVLETAHQERASIQARIDAKVRQLEAIAQGVL